MEMQPVQFNSTPFARPVFKVGAEYTEGAGAAQGSFAGSFNKAMLNLNDVQAQAHTMMEDFASGKDIEVHQVMLGLEKADLSMNLAMQVRNKVLEGYNDIMRMQI